MMVRYYPAVVERAADGFGVFFPDVPGCTSAGATIEHAVRNAEEALQSHLDLSAEHGEPAPDPTPLDAVVSDPEVAEAARVLIRADVGGRARRVNITLPEDLLAAVDRYAKRAGFTRSGLLAQAVRERMAATLHDLGKAEPGLQRQVLQHRARKAKASDPVA